MAIRKLTAAEKAERLEPLDAVRVYSLTEIEKRLGISHRTLQYYVKEGHIKGVKIGGRWKVTHEELQRVLREGTGSTGDGRKKPAGNKKKPKLEGKAA